MSLRRLLAVSFAALAPIVAHAQTSLTFNGSQPNAYNNGSHLVGPFDGSVTTVGLPGSTNLSIYCVDLLNTVGFGNTFQVNVTSLADGTDLSNTRHPGALTAYRQAAWLSNLFSLVPPAYTSTYYTPIQYAMWDMLNPGSAPADPNKTLALNLAAAAASANFNAFSYDVGGGNVVDFGAFDYSRYSVLTDVRSAGTVDDDYRQEFITGDMIPTATPEPATIALVGGGLLAMAGVGRRRRGVVTA
jgi:hypothetical protein